jgi:hypothetical protein
MSKLSGCCVVQLVKRSGSYKHIGKGLAVLARNTDIDDMNMTLIIRHYKEDIDEIKLLNEFVNSKSI